MVFGDQETKYSNTGLVNSKSKKCVDWLQSTQRCANNVYLNLFPSLMKIYIG